MLASRKRLLKLLALGVLFVNCVFINHHSEQSQTYWSDREVLQSNFTSTKLVADTPEDLVERTILVLQNDPGELYDLLSRELTETYNLVDWEEAVEKQRFRVIDIEQVGDLQLIGKDWVSVQLRLQVDDNSWSQFQVVLRQEGRQWRVFGTM